MSPIDYAYDVISGVSIGSINAAALSVYPIGQESQAIQYLSDLWINHPLYELVEQWQFLGPFEGLWRNSFFNNKKLKELV